MVAEELERLPGLRLLLAAEIHAPRDEEGPRLRCPWNASEGAHLVESSRIREPSGYSHISATSLRSYSRDYQAIVDALDSGSQLLPQRDTG
jgi:hypothetical protein